MTENERAAILRDGARALGISMGDLLHLAHSRRNSYPYADMHPHDVRLAIAQEAIWEKERTRERALVERAAKAMFKEAVGSAEVAGARSWEEAGGVTAGLFRAMARKALEVGGVL